MCDNQCKNQSCSNNCLTKLTDKEWPDDYRIEIIGQNGNTGEHYDIKETE